MLSENKKNVLLTGGTGLVGTQLTDLLLEAGYEVSYLSRSKKENPHVKTYYWNIEKQIIDNEAIEKADYIIHLAGSGVADKRWSEHWKREILDSRVQSTRLLLRAIQEIAHQPKAFIAASAIGIYGIDTGENLVDENSPQASNFLAEVTKEWEKETFKAFGMGIRTVLLRIGIVLSQKGGALPKLAQPIKLMAGAALGSGKQYMSWIHVRDLARMFVYALQELPLQGIYNAVASQPVSNEAFTKAVASVLDKPLILPNVPSIALKLLFGEMASVVLGGSKVSNQKILTAGFQYEFDDLERSLKDLLIEK